MKMPSDPRLSCALMPSRVMLIELWSSPLMVELRLPAGVLTPGRLTTKSRTLRLVSGRFWISLVLIVDETVVDCVWTMALAASTLTVSETAPTSSTARTLASSGPPRAGR